MRATPRNLGTTEPEAATAVAARGQAEIQAARLERTRQDSIGIHSRWSRQPALASRCQSVAAEHSTPSSRPSHCQTTKISFMVPILPLAAGIASGGGAEIWRGLVRAEEHRYSESDRGDYAYDQGPELLYPEPTWLVISLTVAPSPVPMRHKPRTSQPWLRP